MQLKKTHLAHKTFINMYKYVGRGGGGDNITSKLQNNS